MEERRLRVSENRIMRRIFGLKGDAVRGEYRKLHNEELSDLYCSPHIVRVIKSKRMRWVGHVARMGRGKAYIGFWWGTLKERDHLEVSGMDGRIILRWILRKWDVGAWTGFVRCMFRPVEGIIRHQLFKTSVIKFISIFFFLIIKIWF
jgi:hypothetical protein